MHNGLHDVVSDHVVLAPGSHKCQKRPTKMKRDLVRSKRGLHYLAYLMRHSEGLGHVLTCLIRVFRQAIRVILGIPDATLGGAWTFQIVPAKIGTHSHVACAPHPDKHSGKSAF